MRYTNSTTRTVITTRQSGRNRAVTYYEVIVSNNAVPDINMTSNRRWAS